MPSPCAPEATPLASRRALAGILCLLATVLGMPAGQAGASSCAAVHIAGTTPLADLLEVDLRAGDRLLRRRLEGRETVICAGLEVLATEARANLGLPAALERERNGARQWVSLVVGSAIAELVAPEDAVWSRFKQLKALAAVGQYQEARSGYAALATAHPAQAADILAAGLATLEGDLNFAAQVTLIDQLLAARVARGDSPVLLAAAELVKAKQLMNMRRLDEAAAIVIRQQTAQPPLPPLLQAMGLQVDAAVHFLRGQIDAAIPRYEQAQAQYAAAAPLSMLRIASLSNLALMDLQRGKLDAALQRYEESITLGARSIPHTLVHARNLHGAGAAALLLHRHALALQRLEAAETLFRSLQPEGPEHQHVRSALAGLLMNTGAAARAESLLRSIIERQQGQVSASGASTADRAALDVRGMLVEAVAMEGRQEEALALLDTLLASLPERRGDSARADLRGSRALILSDLGRLEDALTDAETARRDYLALGRKGLLLANLDVLRGRTLLDLGRLHDAGLVLLDVDQRLAAEGPQSLQQVLAVYERGRWHQARGEVEAALEQYARALDLLEALEQLQQSPLELRKLWAARFADLYRAQVALLLALDRPLPAFAAYARYRQADDRLGAQGRVALDHRMGAARGADLAQVQRGLRSDEVLVAFISAPAALDVLVLGAEGEPQHVRLPQPRKALAEQIQAWLSVQTDPGAAPGDWLQAGRALDAALWAPVRARLPAATRRVRIAADGPLQQLVFAALPDSSRLAPGPDGVVPPLAFRGEQLVYSEQASGLPGPRADGGTDARPLALLALGDPAGTVLDRRAARDRAFALRRDDTLGPLPAARREVEAAAALFAPRAYALLGSAASEAALREALGRAQRLHLATHAVVDPARAFDSWVALAGRTPGSVERLSARQIAGLSGAPPLVVLSACATAAGADAGGAGVLGLVRAWQLAGASEVVATRWAVADRPSAQLMESFWQRIQAGDDPALALAHAQRAWLAQARAGWLGRLGRRLAGADAQPEQALQPFWWAGFVVLR